MKLKIITSGIISLAMLSLSGCSAFFNGNTTDKKAVSSSLVEYLYPDEKSRQAQQPSLPVLRLPITVGIAFLPSSHWQADAIDSRAQVALLNKVKQSFIKYDYIDRIEIIPSTYLKNGKGFNTLQQVARLHDVDVMALVSYDQLMQSHENKSAILYWTIVGMYLIPGNENAIQTFVDTAVFDMRSQKMLFRAPGINQLTESSTAVGVTTTLREKSYEGFELAVNDMIVNLDDELARFKTRVKEEQVATIENKQGYSGGGSLSLLILSLLGIFALRRLTICRE
ncbi:rhombotarget lipoprotein [Shewanella sp.]|uniref:rhombotarget lipoprotein n=1 Tax=Shewanella sp. TaxID=50422 RepID=UPI0026237CB5|nr:rhombotarget lipoprotein [Shewanella sp.]